jgi:ATP phosphoribosyltransferase regulatory subunit
MLNWKLHTPEGVRDILIDECNEKRELEELILKKFKSYGYYEIQTPTYEYYDVFVGKNGTANQEEMIKFFDRDGRILVLRPDITTPIARIIATKYKDSLMPLRFCYVGNAHRHDNDEPYQGTRQREFTQAGVELIGTNTPEADAEVIALTVRTLLSIGVEKFQIEIGQVEFFKGIIEQINFCKEDAGKLGELIDSKASLGIEEFVGDYSINSELKNIIKGFPLLFGGIEVINNINKNCLNKRSISALDNLKTVYSILEDYGIGKYISIDLGMIQSMDYYTGIIFKGFTSGIGFPVCGGGRYDGLINNFGKDIPATGVAFGIDRLMSVLKKGSIKSNTLKPDSLITYTKGGRKRAFQLSEEFRKQGLVIEMFLKESELNDDIKNYARNKKIDGIVTVNSDDKIEIFNVLTEQKIETTMKELLKEETIEKNDETGV